MLRGVSACLCLVALSGPVAAEDFLTINMGSYHFDRSNPLNETNLGAGFGRKWTEICGAETGAYWNSHDKLAIYGLGFCETPDRWSTTFQTGLFLGAASGYQDIPDNYHGVIPIAGLQLTAGPVMLRVNKEVAFLSWRLPIE